MPPLQSGKDTMFKDCLSLCTSELIIWVFIFFIKHCISAYQIFLQIFLLCSIQPVSGSVNGFRAIGHARSLMSAAVSLVSSEHLFWNHRGGADHVFVASHNFGSDTGLTSHEELLETEPNDTGPTQEAHAEHDDDQEDVQGAGRPKRNKRRTTQRCRLGFLVPLPTSSLISLPFSSPFSCRLQHLQGAITIDDLLQAINNLSAELQTTKGQVAALAATGPHGETRWNRPPGMGWRPPPNRPPNGGTNNEAIPRMRVEAPRFNGDDPAGWIFRIQNYFDYFLTPQGERLQLVAMLIDFPASDWFRYYQTNNCGTSWEAFLIAVRQRFDPDYYENYIGSLSKLHQTTSVMAYQTAFETILNKISGVPEQTLIAMYVSGLRQPVQREVNLRNPRTLQEAFGLARELSATHNDSAAFCRPWPSRLPGPGSSSAAPTGSVPTTTGSKVSAPPTAPPLPVVRVSQAQKNERSKKGLCWYCEEKWVPGHHCKGRFLAYMGPDDDDPSDEITPDSSSEVDEGVILADVSSLHSLAGSPSPRALKLVGSVNTHEVNVLLDSGSTHNFVHPSVAERLALVLHPVPPFRVYVGNGDSLRCAYSCPRTPLLLQGTLFEVDLYLLEIHGPDVVLGVQWL
ncbi:unnamed protein product [Cuscuta campestris]|uniref:Ty3 transposon capsid-like protein domain-containing protein n=1 Tax=Cuscuta campestris TaxID=132261 RepID=A0A484KEK8_9ASTE|nr:unnamed protein product [Cuscuta campestris]